MPFVKTTCPYCGVGCGILAGRDADGTVTVKGDPEHPANFGRLCSKGAALAETLDLDGRLLRPEVDGEACDWDTALDTVAAGFRRVIAEHGPGAVAFYVSGQLLTEDYYVANKLMKGFLGSANIDTNSRLCMSSAVAAQTRAFGADSVPCSYEDLEQATLVVLTGSNTAWCHPVIYQRLAAAKRANPEMQVVVLDPRRTATCDIADLHLALRPGSDALLFNGLLAYLAAEGVVDGGFVEGCTEGAEAALGMARETAPDLATVAEGCGLAPETVADFYARFARHDKVVTLYSQGINQSSSGTDKANSIINCHLLSGRIGRPGMGPFSITGQPNAMGGREVGGLANQLAAHMDFAPANVERVRGFWNACAMADRPGLKAVELFRAIEEKRVRAVWIMATNPVVSLPEADRVRAALAGCELVVVSDCMRDTDTAALAHVRLPALTWGERDGTVTNSERRISRQRPFLEAPGEARADWWIVTQVARRLGFKRQFDYAGPAEIFREHAALSGYDNDGCRDFDISGLARLTDHGYDALKPLQWPVTVARPRGTARLFGAGRFFTANGRARLLPVAVSAPASVTDDAFPLRMNTGRVRDHWHTLTRTGKSARLSGHVVEPYAEIHPADAAAAAVEEGGLVRVVGHHGEVVVRARVAETTPPGSIFVPMHWGAGYASLGRVGALIPAAVDPVSGQPESKLAPVRIEPYRPAWHGFLLSRRPLAPQGVSYWSRSRGNGYWRFELAGDTPQEDWGAYARGLLCADAAAAGWVEYLDAAGHRYRGACLVDERLDSCMFIGPEHRLPPRDWLAGLFAAGRLSDGERAGLLSARPLDPADEAGRTVCACFNVGLDTLTRAIREQGLASVAAIGEALKAGSNCGSCIPELRALLAEAGSQDAA